MPLFEYRCQGCGERFEVLVRDESAVECPKCHGQALEKQFSVFAVNAHGSQAPSTPCGRECDSPGGPGGCPMART